MCCFTFCCLNTRAILATSWLTGEMPGGTSSDKKSNLVKTGEFQE